jgi:hypothetical protein
VHVARLFAGQLDRVHYEHRRSGGRQRRLPCHRERGPCRATGVRVCRGSRRAVVTAGIALPVHACWRAVHSERAG